MTGDERGQEVVVTGVGECDAGTAIDVPDDGVEGSTGHGGNLRGLPMIVPGGRAANAWDDGFLQPDAVRPDSGATLPLHVSQDSLKFDASRG
jgi:hypothetical protein